MAKPKKNSSGSGADFLSKFLQSGHVRLDPESKNTIENDKWDKQDFSAIRAELRELSQAQKDLLGITSTGMEAVEDSYYTLKKPVPKVKPDEDVRPSYMVNRRVMGEAMELPAWDKLRVTSFGDEVTSALAAVDLEPKLEIIFDKLQQEQELAEQLEQQMMQAQGLQEEIDDAEEQMQKINAEGGAPSEGEGNDGDSNPQDAQEKAKEALKKLQKAMQETAEKLDAGLDEKMPETRNTLREALEEVNEKQDDMENIQKSWGLDRGALNKLPAKRRIELAARINTERFRQLAKVFGSIMRLAIAQQQKKTLYAKTEICDIHLGNDISHVLPTEFTSLLNPELSYEFYRKFLQRGLMQYKLEGEERVAKGDIIYCVDDETEILTAQGWKHYSDLAVGEDVLTLDHATGRSNWEELQNINVFPAAERTVLRMENNRISSLSTMDHRWPVIARNQGRIWRTSKTLSSDDKIQVSAECASLPSDAVYTDSLVELVAWAWTEGTILPPGKSIKIYQSQTVNPEYCESIRAAMTDFFGEASAEDQRLIRSAKIAAWREDTNNWNIVTFYLNAEASSFILEHLDDEKAVSPEFISSLTFDQLNLFIEKSIDADGTRMRDNGRNCDALGQRSESRIKSFEMACTLAGLPFKTSVLIDQREAYLGKPTYMTTIRRNGKQNCTLPKKWTETFDGMVWCPTTPSGTWLARRNGKVYFTGNCDDGSGSMYGDPEIWAKAVGLALLNVARNQKRGFYGVHFGSPGEYATFDFKPGNDVEYYYNGVTKHFDEIDGTIEYAELFFGGGTDFMTPLTVALAQLQKQHDTFGATKGDIVFATDGHCSVEDHWLAEFKKEQERLKFNVYGIVIGGSVEMEPLNTICDGKVFTVKQMTDGEAIQSILGKV